jgi:TRAP-type C4-dicarboxylate transport system substrate-binding protein
MGNERSVLRKMRIGQLHGGAFTAGSLADVYPDMQIYSLPLAFESYEEVDYVRARMDEVLLKNLTDTGFVSFGLIETGFAYLMSSKPAASFSDLEGKKAWIPEGDLIGEAILDAAGLTPTPLPLSDVLTGLQTGLIDTIAGPPVGAVALQWFTKVKYLTEMPIIYSYGALIVSEKAFKRIDEADQAIVREVMGRVSGELDRRAREDNDGAKRALAKQGIAFIDLTPENLKQWQEVADEATKRLAEKKVFSPEMMAEIEEHITAFRKQASDRAANSGD